MTETGGEDTGTLTYRGVVHAWHCDHMEHMNVMWYVGKFDEATWTFFAENGLTPSYLRDSGRGMAAVEQNLKYLRELHAGDVVRVTTTLLEAAPRKIRFVHKMYNDITDELAATCELTGVHLDTKARCAIAFEDAVAVQLADRFAKDTGSLVGNG